jgi:hypothetical protein
MMAEVTKPLKDLASITPSISPSYEQIVKPAQEKLAESTKAKAEVAGAEKAMLTQAEADRQKTYQQAGETAAQAVKTSPVFTEKEEVYKKTSEPFIPTKDDVKDIAALYSLVNVVGMAMGAGGKQNSMQAMHAMNGMLEGYQKGRQDLYKKEKDKFDVNMKNLKSRYDMLDKQLKDVMTLAQTDREASRQAADVLFAQTGANFYKQMADKIGLAGLYEYHKQAYDAANKLFSEKNRLEAQAEQRSYRERSLAMQERRLQISEDKARGGGKGGKDFGSPSELVEKTTGAKLKDKDATDVALAANAVGDASAIKQIVKEHPEWVGRSGQIRNFFNRTIESINLGQPSPDDKGQPELIFAKRYAEYLANYERALAGGARGFTVYFQRRFNALLEQNQFNAAGMSNLMDEQIRTITSQVASKSDKITRESLSRLALNIKERSGDEEAVRGLSAGGKAPEQPSAPQAGTQPKEGDKDKSKSGKPIVYRNGAWEYE